MFGPCFLNLRSVQRFSNYGYVCDKGPVFLLIAKFSQLDSFCNFISKLATGKWEKKTKQGFAIAHTVSFMLVLLFFSLF